MIAPLCVTFRNGRGHQLTGMLHLPPAESARGICILMLSPGMKACIGPHRLYLKFAERIVPLGYHLLRFDFFGLGDSEGELAEEVLADVYNAIQGGRYIGDTVAAMDWMRDNYGIERFIGSGLCGGSITSLLTAARDPRIYALLGIGLPAALDGGEANWGRFLTAQQAKQARRGFIERLIRPASWRKFLTGQSNYKVIARVLAQAFSPRRPFERSATPQAQTAVADDTNPYFAPAFFNLIESGRRAILIYSGGDRLQSQFEEKFELRHRVRLQGGRPGYEIHTIAQANHIMSAPEWVEELCNVASDWLQGAGAGISELPAGSEKLPR